MRPITTETKLRVSGTPKAQPRAKARCVNGTAYIYNPSSANSWKRNIRQTALEEGIKKVPGPVAISLFFRFPRPKSHFGTGRNAHLVKASAPSFHAQKPDTDNLAKAVLDSLCDGGFIDDDANVVSLLVCKSWESLGEPAGVDIRIMSSEIEPPALARKGAPSID